MGVRGTVLRAQLVSTSDYTAQEALTRADAA